MAWEAIVGHARAKRLLQQHLAMGRVASAYLLAGPEGVGKRGLAMEFAKALNCAHAERRPCDSCPACRQIHRGTHPDVHVIGPSSTSDQIKIDDVRHLLSRIALKPFSATFQIAIVDGAERLTEEAANSLLKALEEPPAHTRFLLLTARWLECLPTIRSRCQLIRCEPLPAVALQQLVMERAGCDAVIAEALVPLARGSVSVAMDLARRWAPYHAVLTQCAEGTLAGWVEQPLPESRQEAAHLLDGMIGWVRDLTVTVAAQPAASPAPGFGTGRSGQVRRLLHTGHTTALARQANAMDVDRCLAVGLQLVRLRESLDQFVSPRLVGALAREQWLSLQS